MPTDPQRAPPPSHECERAGFLKLAQFLVLMVGISVLTAVLSVLRGKTVMQAILTTVITLLVMQVGYVGSILYFAYRSRRKDPSQNTSPRKRRSL